MKRPGRAIYCLIAVLGAALCAAAPAEADTVTRSLGTLESGKSVTITFEARIGDPLPPAKLVLSTQGILSGSTFPDVPTDDPDTPAPLDATVTPVDPAPDLEVVKTGDAEARVGDPVHYTVSVRNQSGSEASGVTLVDTLPAGVSFDSASPGCLHDAGVVTCGLGALLVGGEATVTMTVYIGMGAPGFVTNTAAASSLVVDRDPSDNTDVAVTQVNRAAVRNDFDGDRTSDLALFHPMKGRWLIEKSTEGVERTVYGYCCGGTVPVPADFDGDGVTDVAVLNPLTMTWYWFGSRSGHHEVAYGPRGSTPVPADFDGDGRADIAVFDPADGTWHIAQSRDGERHLTFGPRNGIPLAADFDGDGRADPSIYLKKSRRWYTMGSSAGPLEEVFPHRRAVPLAADFDGDGVADRAFYRKKTRTWHIYGSSTGYRVESFGRRGARPVPADFDGDGLTEPAVYKAATRTWFIRWGTSGLKKVTFGRAGMIPAGYVR